MLPAFLKQLPLPPVSLFLLALFGLAILRWRPRLGRFCMGFALAALYALSTPLVGGALIRGVQAGDALTRYDHDAGAIVVLGAGVTAAAEYGGDTVSSASLVRLRYAARLNRLSGQPILVTGGWGSDLHLSEGEAMAQALETSFRAAAQWVETQAANTYENAVSSAAILHPLGITRIYLVTNGWHMRRGVAAFEAAGFEVIPAPTAIHAEARPSLTSLIPNAGSLGASAIAVHEWLGLIWYRLVYF